MACPESHRLLAGRVASPVLILTGSIQGFRQAQTCEPVVPYRRPDNPDAHAPSASPRSDRLEDTRMPYHPVAQRSGRPTQVHSNNANRNAC